MTGLALLLSLGVAQAATSILESNASSSYGVASQSETNSDSSLPFSTYVEFTVPAAGPYIYSSAAVWNTVSAVSQNDLLVVTFWIRNKNTSLQTLKVDPSFQISAFPYTSSMFANAPVDDGAWHQYVIPFRVQVASAAGSSNFQFQCGNTAQTFDIGGLTVIDYGQVSSIPSDLSSTFAFYYPGRGNPSAPWRTQALQNIEQYRKGQIEIRVVDGTGNPVTSEPVAIKETKSAFYWGSAIDSSHVQSDTDLTPADFEHYTSSILSNFNLVVFENDMKWPSWAANKQLALNGLAWAKANSLVVRGHNLIWPSWQYMPANCDPALPATACSALTASELQTAITNHFQDEAGTLAGQLWSWDVVNEPYDNNNVQGTISAPGTAQTSGVLGNLAIAGWYQLVRQLDPNVRLELNDFSIFEGLDPVHRAYDLALVQFLWNNGAELDDFNFESHFSFSAPIFSDMDETIAMLNPYVQHFGVTEFDFLTIDPSLMADLTTDYMTYIFGQPKFDHFLMWGFWDGAHWFNWAPLYNLDWSLKTSGQAFQQLTQHTWWTNSSGVTDGAGVYQTRAFKGAYQVTIGTGSSACSFNVQLDAGLAITTSSDCTKVVQIPGRRDPFNQPAHIRKL